MAKTNTKAAPSGAAEEKLQPPAAQAVEPPGVLQPELPPSIQESGAATEGDLQQADAQAADQPPALPPEVTGMFAPDTVEVVAKCEQFRRAGRLFTREVTRIPLSELTVAEFEMLCQEPMLSLQLLRVGGGE
ncbi:hypothetical protein [Chromobacterium aquaticum]|uniref:Mu-like prophage FluMu N-terminal domain-containing protein n=1 Tax=Chromobacterium aquaticum TaxID=467180 RepID=A0ABV8ZVW9_9NEIS|nr:hypothetical protein [Chromobacterium aquaticum]MCD5362796.1 hypothetical protein [Chromobacterium aquaticum]